MPASTKLCHAATVHHSQMCRFFLERLRFKRFAEASGGCLELALRDAPLRAASHQARTTSAGRIKHQEAIGTCRSADCRLLESCHLM